MIKKPVLLDGTLKKINAAINAVRLRILGAPYPSIVPGAADAAGVEPVAQDDTGNSTIAAINAFGEALDGMLDSKQEALVSGTNIKTINNESLLGAGNIDIYEPTDFEPNSILISDDDGKAVSSEYLNVYPGGSGIALGKVAEFDQVVDSEWPIQTSSVILANGGDIQFHPRPGTNDPGDLVFYYDNGKEKSRIWSKLDAYTTAKGPNYRIYDYSGNLIYDGALALEPSDYVVEQGTDGIWTYRKWNSGIAECWGRQTYSAEAFAPVVNVFYRVLPTLNWPSGLFISAPVATAGLDFGNIGGCTLSNVTAISAVPGVLSANAATREINMSYQAFGKWK